MMMMEKMNEYYNGNNNNKEEIVNLFNVITTYILHLKDSLVIRQQNRKGIKSHDILPLYRISFHLQNKQQQYSIKNVWEKKGRQDFLNVLTYLDISMDIEMENQQNWEIPLCAWRRFGAHFRNVTKNYSKVHSTWF